MASQQLTASYDAAVKAQAQHPADAIKSFRDIAVGSHPNDADSIKVKENAVTALADLYAKQKDAQALRGLLTELRPLFGAIPKAKTAKLVRGLIEAISRVPDSTQLQLDVCREQVEWATAEKRTFLRQRIEARLVALQLQSRNFTAALSLIGKLLTEVKRLDDKLLLVEVHLLESRTHHALRNLPKAKAALTAARAAANAIYMPPVTQAELDTQSGILHAEEKDYKTGYSYFYEAFEGLNTLDNPEAVGRLKYMLLCKIMTSKGDAEEVPAIISSRAGLKYAGDEVDSMAAVAKAYAERSLQGFQAALDAHREQLAGDPVVHTHLQALYGTLMEQNLARLIEPFSRVEIDHVAHLIQLPVATVEAKLSQMILDGKLAGTLDAGSGCLEVFDEPPQDAVFPSALESLTHLGAAIDTLAIRSQKAVGGELSAERKAAWAAWAADWRRQLQAEGRQDDERQAAQNAVNPAYIPRNHVMQTAIAAAEKGNSSEVNKLMEVLKQPFEEQSGAEAYTVPAPKQTRVGVELLSCSS